MKLTSFFTLFFLLIINVPCVVAADDGIVEYIHLHPELAEENIFIYDGNSHATLISIGVAEVKGNSPMEKLKAMRIAKMNAQGNIMKYLHGVFSESEKDFTDITIVDANALTPTTVHDFNEILRERGSGIIRHVREISRWHNKTQKLYFIAMGVDQDN